MRVNKINVFLCFILLFTFSISTDVAFETLTPSIPGTVYPYTFTSGQVLVLTATWTTTADIDFFMYPAGTDILTGAPQRSSTSTNANSQTMTYTIPASRSYYIKALLYSSPNPTNFKLTIQVDGVIQKTYYDTAVQQTTHLTVAQFQTTNICKMKLTYSGPTVMSLKIFAPGAALSGAATYTVSPISTTYQFDVTQAGGWTIALDHNLTSAKVIKPVSLALVTLSTDQCTNFCAGIAHSLGLAPGQTNICMCQRYYKWNSGTSTCDQTCSGTPSDPVCSIQCTLVPYINGTVVANASSCLCQTYFNFDNLIDSCKINCGLVPFATGAVANTNDQCTCQTGYYFSVPDCVIDCSVKSNANGTVSATACSCINLYAWDVATSNCKINCSLVTEANSASISSKADVCSCLPTNTRCSSLCGNGVIDQGQQCDDGNNISADGCTSQCKSQPKTPSALTVGLAVGLTVGGVVIVGAVVAAIIITKKAAAAAASAGGAATATAGGGSSANIADITSGTIKAG